MGRPRGTVRYHVPRRRSPVPAVLVGTLVVVTLVSAQLAIADDRPGTATAPTAAAATAAAEPTAAAVPDGSPEPADDTASTAPTAPQAPSPDAAPSLAEAPSSLPMVEVTFAVGADVPSGDPGELLGPVVDALLADPSARVRVVGHAEVSNDPVLEEQLSLRRAETVLDWLGDQGLPPGRADVFAAGATQAGTSLAGNDRRVTVEVLDG